VYLAGITANPDGAWVVQQARNLTMTLAEQKQRHRIRPVTTTDQEWRDRRDDRLGGLLHEYELAA